MSITKTVKHCDPPRKDEPSKKEPSDWAIVVKYNYYLDDKGSMTIQIQTEGNCHVEWKIDGDDTAVGANMLRMLRFHRECEFNLKNKSAFRALGRHVGTGEIL